MDFSGGPVVKNLPAGAGDTGFDPWSGKIPRALEQLSSGTTTLKPACHRALASQQEKLQQREALESQ